MPYYEHVVVMRPDISPQQVDSFVEEITSVVSEMEGSVARTEYWGLRSLSYPIRKSRKGHYTMLNIEAPTNVVAELERRHRINEDILRYLTVRVDELSEDPSPMMSRKDRGERGDRGDRRPRRDRES